MWWVLSSLVGLCLYGLMRLLHVAAPSMPPSLCCRSPHSHFVQALLASCSILREPYVPPLLWGKSGHLQTIVYAKMGRMLDPEPRGSRHTKILKDGSTLTFDLYNPTANAPANETWMMMVCPGFGSSSESSYIRGLVTHAQARGFHLAVLNHLGSLFSLPLTAPRIFSYGGWEEFHLMRQEVESLFPQSRIIMVGLSMGANIVLKYLGQHPKHQRNVTGAVSVCQGYNINDAKDTLKSWQNMRRAYLYTMTANQKRLIHHHSKVLFSEDIQQTFDIDQKKVFSATTLEDLDKNYACKMHGYTDVAEFYEHHSCSNYISTISIPLVLLNSEDDPIVPSHLLKHARNYAETHESAVFVTTKHGGHLGFFEHGLLRPDHTSWMDRFVCQMSAAILIHTPHPAPANISVSLSNKAKVAEGELNPQPSPTTRTFTELSAGEGSTLRHRASQSQASKTTPDPKQKREEEREEEVGVGGVMGIASTSTSSLSMSSSSFLRGGEADSQLSSLAEEKARLILDDAASQVKAMGSVLTNANDLMS